MSYFKAAGLMLLIHLAFAGLGWWIAGQGRRPGRHADRAGLPSRGLLVRREDHAETPQRPRSRLGRRLADDPRLRRRLRPPRHAGQHAASAHLHHRRVPAERLRGRPRHQPRLDRRHRRPAQDAVARRGFGRGRPRAGPREARRRARHGHLLGAGRRADHHLRLARLSDRPAQARSRASSPALSPASARAITANTPPTSTPARSAARR